MNGPTPPSSFDRYDKPARETAGPVGSVVLTADHGPDPKTRIGRLLMDVQELMFHSEIGRAGEAGEGPLAEIVFGNAKARTTLREIRADYSGWTAAVGPNASSPPLAEVVQPNPITSLFTAAAVVAAIFRLGPWKEAEGVESRPMVVSLLVADRDETPPPRPESLELGVGPTVVYGCGSIAHATGWALSGLDGGSGRVILVDNSAVAEKNVHKYLGLNSKDLGLPKTQTMAKLLESTGFRVERADMTASEFGRSQPAPPPLAVTCTDTGVSRRDIQSRLPGLVLDGWSGNDPLMLQAGVGWRGFARGGSCLICNHWETREPHPDREAEARKYGYSAHELASAIRENRGLPPRTGFQQIDIGEVTGVRDRCDEVPSVDGRRQYSVPFVAAAAGAMVALELSVLADVRLRRFRRRLPNLRLGIHPNGSDLYPDRTAPKRVCLCRDGDWVSAYRRLWPQLPHSDFVDAAVDW